jgi:hypothetical protein
MRAGNPQGRKCLTQIRQAMPQTTQMALGTDFGYPSGSLALDAKVKQRQ